MRKTLFLMLLLAGCGGGDAPLSRVEGSLDLRVFLNVGSDVAVSVALDTPNDAFNTQTCLKLSPSATATIISQPVPLTFAGGSSDHASELGTTSRDCRSATFDGHVPRSSFNGPTHVVVTDGDGNVSAWFEWVDPSTVGPGTQSTLQVTTCQGPASCTAREQT